MFSEQKRCHLIQKKKLSDNVDKYEITSLQVSSKGCIEQLTKYCGKENQGGGLEGRWSWSEGKEDGRVNLEFIFFVTDANDASCLLHRKFACLVRSRTATLESRLLSFNSPGWSYIFV